MFILDFFTVQYSRIPQPLGRLNSATIGHIAIILFAFYSEYCLCENRSRFLWYLNSFLTKYCEEHETNENSWHFIQNVLYLEKYWKYRKFEWRFFDSHSTKHLAKRKNEIGLTVYELKIETWKKEHFTSKWNNNGKTVKWYFKRS